MNIKIDLGGSCFILFIVFLVLKLCGVIAWSWWWVTAPLWIPLSLCVGVFLIAIAFMGIVALWENIVDWWRWH